MKVALQAGILKLYPAIAAGIEIIRLFSGSPFTEVVFLSLIIRNTLTFLLVAVFSVSSLTARAQAPSLIRDAEIENTIRAYATPLFEAAKLEPSDIKVHLVNDKSLNAFVAGGLNLFMNTGLLIRSTDAGQVIGVIAHETGHILGGHLARRKEAVRNAQAKSLLGFVLGGVAAAAGRGDVAMAAVRTGEGAGISSILAYTRGHESSADTAAIKLLEQTKQSASGLASFMQILADQELLSSRRQDPYLRTHPITSHLVDFIEAHLKKSAFTNVPPSPAFTKMHLRMKAKLKAFMERPSLTLRSYKRDDPSVPARYARSIAYYRMAKLDEAIPLIEGLIADEPNNPYFHELKGQMLFENGRVDEAILAYEKAAELLPNSALILIDYARTKLESHDPAYLESSIKDLATAIRQEPRSAFAWRQFAIATGRKGEMGMSALALAEEAYLLGRRDDAMFQVAKAEHLLPEGSRGWIRSQDIKAQLGGSEN